MQLVSVIIGTYNGSKYIETQLQSIIKQSYSNLEIIIVDDASTDNTIEIVENIAKGYNHIHVHAYDINVGYIQNFERGIALASGKLIALSDQDDWWHPSKIESLVEHINDKDLIYCDSAFVNEELQLTGERFSTIKNLFSSTNPLNFLIDNCVSGHAMLFKKTLFEKAKPFPKLVPHDWWLTYLAALNNGITYLDKPLVHYRLHVDNVIASNTEKKEKVEKLIERNIRLRQFYNASHSSNHKSEKIVLKFRDSYNSSTFFSNMKRALLFFKYKKDVLKILKKSEFKKIIFCLNMFFKIK